MTSFPNNIQAILFDMDGVLCDSEAFIAAAAAQMLKETYGIHPTRSDFALFIGMGEDRFIGGTAEKFGVKVTLPRDKDRTYAIYLDLIKGKLEPLHGVKEFIEDARQRGLKLAIASSADDIKVLGNLLEIGLPFELFDAIVCGKDVVYKKPAPDIFLLASEKLGVDPRHAIVAEDALSGVQAAVSAGCLPLGITTAFSAEELSAKGALWTAANLGEARKLFL